MKLSILVAAASAAVVTAIGESCNYWDPGTARTWTGTCQYTSTCTSQNRFYVSNRCAGPSNVRCCIAAGCRNPAGTTGHCLNTSSAGNTKCFNWGGRFLTGMCPGPSDVQCCLVLG